MKQNIRLPCQAIPWHEICGHFDCIVDRGQEPLPRVGIRRHRSALRRSCYRRYHQTPHQTKVRIRSLILDHSSHLCTSPGNSVTCPSCHGIGSSSRANWVPVWLLIEGEVLVCEFLDFLLHHDFIRLDIYTCYGLFYCALVATCAIDAPIHVRTIH